MPRTNPYRPFSPCSEQQELIPEISGNDINGLGETNPRAPDYIYWNDPDKLAHGEMQRWFYMNDPDNTELQKARADRAQKTDVTLSEISTNKSNWDAATATSNLLAQADAFDFEMTGITTMKPDYLFKGKNIDHPYVIMIGVVHEYERIINAPEDVAGAEVVRQYGRAMRGAIDIASWIRQNGYEAEPHTGPMAGKLMMIPPAIDCGFGELGKHGSMINAQYGSSFRLSAVTTDMPLIPTPANPLWVDDFCTNCKICEDACPPEAISSEKQMVRGVEKWYVDFDKCIPFFNEHFGCAMCIAQCPWSKPDIAPRLALKLAKRRERQDASST